LAKCQVGCAVHVSTPHFYDLSHTSHKHVTWYIWEAEKRTVLFHHVTSPKSQWYEVWQFSCWVTRLSLKRH